MSARMTRTGRKQIDRLIERLATTPSKLCAIPERTTPKDREWARFISRRGDPVPTEVIRTNRVRLRKAACRVKAARVTVARGKDAFRDKTGRYNPGAWRMRYRGCERRMVVALVFGKVSFAVAA